MINTQKLLVSLMKINPYKNKEKQLYLSINSDEELMNKDTIKTYKRNNQFHLNNKIYQYECHYE